MAQQKSQDNPGEDDKLKRIRELDPVLYKQILDLESEIYLDLNAKMEQITEVKEMILAYDGRGARERFKEVYKKIGK